MSDGFDFKRQLTDDLLEQFRGKPNTEVLVSALSRQLQEVFRAFDDLKEKRSIDEAEGVQLDGIGDIVVLDRSRARALEAEYRQNEALDDERFRDYLKYKIFLNTNTCTYKDVIKALKMFWDLTPLYYSEDPNEPATMIFRTPTVPPEIDTSKLLNVPAIKAGGVRLRLEATTETPMPEFYARAAGVIFNGVVSTTLPQILFDFQYGGNLEVLHRSERVAQTVLPQIT